MKIVVFGASGKSGSLIVSQALEAGHQVTAYVRNESGITQKNPNLKVVVGNLTETFKLKEAITGADVCISTLGGGSLTHHSPEIIDGIDKIVSIMEQKGVNRIIYLSSLGARESRFFMPQPIRFLIADIMLRVPLADHNANENRIVNSKLNWTIVRPGGLTDNEKTGNLKFGSEKKVFKGSTSISRANVAAFILEQVSNLEFVNKSVWLTE
jgi:putative NADH-flavin reductase